MGWQYQLIIIDGPCVHNEDYECASECPANGRIMQAWLGSISELPESRPGRRYQTNSVHAIEYFVSILSAAGVESAEAAASIDELVADDISDLPEV